MDLPTLSGPLPPLQGGRGLGHCLRKAGRLVAVFGFGLVNPDGKLGNSEDAL